MAIPPGHSFSLDDFDMADLACTVISGEEPWLPSADASSIGIPGVDGSVAGLTRRAARRIPVPVLVEGSTTVAWRTNLDSIAREIFRLRTDRELKFDKFDDRFWKVRPGGIAGIQRIVPTSGRAVLNFSANDPDAFAATETTESFTLDADPKTIVTSSIPGSALVEAEFRIELGADIVTSIQIQNTTAGTDLLWVSSTTGLPWVRANSAIQRMETSVDLGTTWVASMLPLLSTSVFPFLLPNLTNSITITGVPASPTSTLRIIYRARFI